MGAIAFADIDPAPVAGDGCQLRVELQGFDADFGAGLVDFLEFFCLTPMM